MVGTIENAAEKGRRLAGEEGESPKAEETPTEDAADAEQEAEPEPAGVS
jgi:hypothetical protein